MSDGCAAQYKHCKNFHNLCHHFDDFGVRAQWHFFATSHGKSAGDGAGGTLKRLATRASLQHIYEHHILTARQLYDFAVSIIKGMHFGFATAGEHEHEARLLDDRMKSSKTVPGTHQLHSVIPISANTVGVRSFSNSTCSRTEKVAVAEVVNTLLLGDIRGYVTVAYNASCWLGYVLNVDASLRTITVTFLHPCIPSTSFVYPVRQDVMDVDPSDVLTLVNPVTATGRTYTVTRKNMQEASLALQARLL